MRLGRLATRRRLAVTLLATAALARSSRAAPAGADPASFSIEGTCPDQAAVAAAIGALVPRGVAALPEAAQVRLIDLGETYRVEARSDSAARTRTFRDPTRDCDQRARFAAVFIVLTLLPPELALGVEPEPPPKPPTALGPPPPQPPPPPAPP